MTRPSSSFFSDNKGILFALVTSLVWLYFALNYILVSGWWEGRHLLSSAEFIGQISGFLMPVVLFLLLGAFVDKSAQMKKRDEELRFYLNELVYPSSDMPLQTQELLGSLREELVVFKKILSVLQERSEDMKMQLTAWTSQLSKIGTILSEQTQKALNQLEAKTSRLAEVVEQTGEQTQQASGIFSEQAVILQRVTEQTHERMTALNEQFQIQIDTARKVGGEMEKERLLQQNTAAHLENMIASFSKEGARLTETAAAYEERVQKQNGRVFSNLEKILSVFKAHGDLLEEEVSRSLGQLQSFEKSLSSNASQVLQMGQEGVSQLTMTGNLFDERYQKLLSQLKSIQDEMRTVSREIEKNAQTVDKKLVKALKKMPVKDMLKEAGSIISRLQQSSINISHIFTPKIQEELWEKYYAGDKSVFMRHITRMISTKKMKQLKELYDTNEEFNSLITGYMSEFEAMTKMIQQDEENNLLMNSLLGSDMGHLYMVLADIFKKE